MRLTIVALLSLFAFSLSAEILVGLVDIQKAVGGLEEGKVAMTKAESKAKELNESLQKKEKAFRDAEDKFQKSSGIMDNKAKEQKRSELGKMQNELFSEQQKSQVEYQKLEQDLQRPILDKLQEIIRDVSKQEKVDISFVKGMGGPVYAAKEMDLTDKVVEAYNKKYPIKK